MVCSICNCINRVWRNELLAVQMHWNVMNYLNEIKSTNVNMEMNWTVFERFNITA